MQSKRALGRWFALHEWTSLVCTLFILTACLTGLPLIFHHELESLFAEEDDGVSGKSQVLNFDGLLASAEAANPGMVVQMVLRQQTDPNVTIVGLGRTIDAPLEESLLTRVSNFDGRVLDAGSAYDGLLGTLTQIHVELLAGQMGMFFLGLMTILLLLAIISGVVLYAPFMGNRSFATVRDGDTRRRWFDLHNSLGMILAVWLFVVSITGAVNTIGSPMIQMWLMTDMQTIVADDMAQPIAESARRTSFQAAFEESQQRLPDSDFYFAMFPGNGYSSDRHYLIFNTGREPLSSRLFKPVIINAYTGDYIAAPELPAYLQMLLLSQPLHFGDYGGIWLKVAWAVLDVAAIVLLWSGLVLWWRRRRQGREALADVSAFAGS